MADEPKVFISYSHDDERHEQRVLTLANDLRDDGIDAEIDQYEPAPPEGWPMWCERQIKRADFVLLVCTETHHRRVDGEEKPGKGHGVLWEARIIRQLLYDAGSVSAKFIPVLFTDGSADYIPTPVRGAARHVVDTEAGYEGLCRQVTQQPGVIRPRLGKRKALPPKQPWSEAAAGARSARRDVPVVRIFLSSSGDVAEERAQARQLIDSELPTLPRLRERVKLELIAWDDPAAHIPLLANDPPQESVNAARPRPAACDIVIVILWARMGTPLPDIRKPNGEPYLSGTEWEYEDAINSPRQPPPGVLVYRRTEKPTIRMRDPEMREKEEQFERTEAFCAQLRAQRRGINEYATPTDFRPLLRQHLEDILYRRLRPSDGSDEARPASAVIPAEYYAWLRRSFEKVELLGPKEGRAQPTLSWDDAIGEIVRMQIHPEGGGADEFF